ncbi:MAG: 50S ribosomal protein L29 [Anaerolineae bacterium]|nr:50S ribosomal protein L29 [Anaerolineae bacterium]
MQIQDVVNMSATELAAKLDESYRELFNLRFQRAGNQLTDTNSITRVRKTIARIKTVQRQRELAAQMTKAE